MGNFCTSDEVKWLSVDAAVFTFRTSMCAAMVGVGAQLQISLFRDMRHVHTEVCPASCILPDDAKSTWSGPV